jgi:coenzyme Q-binding protein COQ10
MPTHAETRLLPYTPEQLFDLVADIERYPEFLPWCVGARVRAREGDLILGDLLIGWKMVREKFTSRVHLHRPGAIEVEYAEGPFKYLENYWKFIPQPGGGTLLDFHVDFEFRSHFLSGIIATLFNEAVRRMVAAFERRARELYGAKPI